MARSYGNCTVDGAGATTDVSGHGDPGSYVQLTESGGAFQRQFFGIESSVSNQILATALTAISIGRSVSATVDPPPYRADTGIGDEPPNCYDLSITPR